jgi:hypothetical protein
MNGVDYFLSRGKLESSPLKTGEAAFKIERCTKNWPPSLVLILKSESGNSLRVKEGIGNYEIFKPFANHYLKPEHDGNQTVVARQKPMSTEM